MTAAARPWRLPLQDSADLVGAQPQSTGLSTAEAGRRLAQFGPNKLRKTRPRSVLAILLAQLRSVVTLLLAVAAVLSFVFGGLQEGVAIVVVIVVNTLIGFSTELRATRSMEALRKLGSVRTRVRRDGRELSIPAERVVPGDILVLEAGDIVTADGRLLTASRLQVDESTFTGESVPVEKDAEQPVESDRVDERTNSLFKGTSLTRGACEAVVIATGENTELGRIAALTSAADSGSTPLERQLDRLGNRLIVVTAFIAVAVIVAGVAAGKPLMLMVETGIALAVATIPEGLPIVATVALARGLWRMSRRNALINRLAAVETLGATTAICTDKTGTLTQNRMSVERVLVGDLECRADDCTGNVLSRELLETAVLCNHASLESGDPLEVALLAAAASVGIHRSPLIEQYPQIDEIAFDAETRLMVTVHRRQGGEQRVAVKGAPEAVLGACTNVATERGVEPFDDAQREEWSARSERLAADGLRMIAIAGKSIDADVAPVDVVDRQAGLTWYGLVAMVDPPRLEVATAIDACRRAGIRILMLTGDHPATAEFIAEAVGLSAADGVHRVVTGMDLAASRSGPDTESLLRASVYARVDPAQKLNLVRRLQAHGEVVAMIGDGVNDAPALRQADIGIAMGERGTAVAREAADMVLTDDSFRSIVAAVEQGRVIFGNIRRFVIYLLSCNTSEVLIVAISSAIHVPLPILPIQILFLNLVSDVFPALALGMGSGSTGIMHRPPRRSSEGVLTRRHALGIAVYGAIMTASVLGVFVIALAEDHGNTSRAVSVAFLTLAFAQLFHVFNMRAPGTRLIRNEITSNAWVWGALSLCTIAMLASVYVPWLATVLVLEVPTGREWLLILGFSLVPFAVGQTWLSLRGEEAV